MIARLDGGLAIMNRGKPFAEPTFMLAGLERWPHTGC